LHRNLALGQCAALAIELNLLDFVLEARDVALGGHALAQCFRHRLGMGAGLCLVSTLALVRR
jgi:hypothetical protein